MESANVLVPIAMFGCIVVFLVLFATMEPRRALLASFIGAWLFLPQGVYELEGLPDYSKLFATCFGILLGVFVFDFKRLLAFRPKWVDIPIIIWCIVPLGASITNFGFNQSGIYDGLSESLDQIVLWGVPYLLGRIYFTNWKEIRELAIAMLISGLVYLPLLLFEMRMSPQLHRLVYGYHQHLFLQTQRFGLWRPMVFMQHGLMVAFWMMAIAVVAVWMARARAIERVLWRGRPIMFSWVASGALVVLLALLTVRRDLWLVLTLWALGLGAIALLLRQTQALERLTWGGRSIPFSWLAGLFVAVVLLMVSVNAWLWLSLSLATLFASVRLRSRLPIITLLLLAPAYIGLQASNTWPTELTVDFATGVFGPERAQSLEYRYFNEYYLTQRAREQPLFGWAGWDRQHVQIEWGPRTVADSLWIIFFGKFGTIGLLSLMLSILLPAILFVYRYPPWIWIHPNVAPGAAMAIVLVMYMFDGLLNAMINPIYMLTAGGLLGVLVNLPQLESRRSEAQPRGQREATAT